MLETKARLKSHLLFGLQLNGLKQNSKLMLIMFCAFYIFKAVTASLKCSTLNLDSLHVILNVSLICIFILLRIQRQGCCITEVTSSAVFTYLAL